MPDTIRHRRLAFRSRYRGAKEADLLFAQFVERHLAGLSDLEMDQYEALLEEADQDILAWVTGRRHVPARHDHAVFQKLKSFEPKR